MRSVNVSTRPHDKLWTRVEQAVWDVEDALRRAQETLKQVQTLTDELESLDVTGAAMTEQGSAPRAVRV